MRILLVDDEFLALNLLEEYISRVPGLTVVGKAKTAIHAMEILQQQPVDLLFLDIQMPVLSGINFLKTLTTKPATIFTTAYSEHAVAAYDLNVLDYLLKPYSFERFMQAINKAKKDMPKTTENEEPTVETPEFIVIKVDGRLQKVLLSELLYVEGLKEYVKVVSTQKQYVTFERMKNLEERLPTPDFLRVHKSYIVAKRYVQSIEGHLLDLGKIKIPVSRERKEDVIKAIFG